MVEVSEAEEDRTWRLLAAHPAISLHDHLEVAPDDITQQDEWVREAHLATGYEGLARSGLAAVFGSYGIPSGALLASGDSEYDSVVPEYVVGLENIGDFPNIVRWLVKHGYSDDEIGKVISGNTLRLLEQAWSRWGLATLPCSTPRAEVLDGAGGPGVATGRVAGERGEHLEAGEDGNVVQGGGRGLVVRQAEGGEQRGTGVRPALRVVVTDKESEPGGVEGRGCEA